MKWVWNYFMKCFDVTLTLEIQMVKPSIAWGSFNYIGNRRYWWFTDSQPEKFIGRGQRLGSSTACGWVKMEQLNGKQCGYAKTEGTDE